MENFKKCSKCGETKSLTDFHNCKSKKDGKFSACKMCRNVSGLALYHKNKDKYSVTKKKYKNKNKEIIKSKNKEYYERNKDKIKENYEEKKNKMVEYRKKYRSENYDKVRKREKEYLKKKRIDPIYRLKDNIRHRIRQSLKANNIKKNNKTNEILGCTLNEFKIYIESKFEPWMTWDNYGNPKDGILEPNKTWDIDHIIPLSSSKNEVEIIKLNHYTNLQPLCSYINRKIKRDK